VAKPIIAHSAQESTAEELVECSRCEGEKCPRCDGSGFMPRKRCAGCGEPAGRASEGGKDLLGLKNRKGKDEPMWCLNCHPDSRFLDAHWSCLERLEDATTEEEPESGMLSS
jgi:hypothetical protein